MTKRKLFGANNNWIILTLDVFSQTLFDQNNDKDVLKLQTSQELRMLSSVTINCQVTMIVMNPGSQLSVL